MPREYRHMKQYEKEILELKAKGLTQREIGEQLGFRQSQVKEFFKRYNRNKRKLASGIAIKPKGRPRKDGTELPPSIQQLGIFWKQPPFHRSPFWLQSVRPDSCAVM